MRLLMVSREPKLPLLDCEIGSRMIALCGRKPRANWHQVPRERVGAVAGTALGLVALGYALTVLLLTF